MRTIAAILCVIVCGLCQTPAPPSSASPLPARYESLFREVAWVPGSPQTPAIPDAIGLTDDEKAILRAIATEWASKDRGISDAYGRLVLEARFRFIESGESTADLPDRQKVVDAQRSKLMADHIQKLKDGLGESGIQKVEDYLRARQEALDAAPRVVLLNGEQPRMK